MFADSPPLFLSPLMYHLALTLSLSFCLVGYSRSLPSPKYRSAFNCCSLKTFSGSKVSLFVCLVLLYPAL